VALVLFADWFFEGRYEPTPRWASPEGAEAGGNFSGLPQGTTVPRGRPLGTAVPRGPGCRGRVRPGFHGLAGGCSGYLRMSGGGAPMRSKASPQLAGRTLMDRFRLA